MTEQIQVTLPIDEKGYLGRECPSCEKYFKIMPGTGLADTTTCYCPYCGRLGDVSDFNTTDQVEYAKSVALRTLQGHLNRSLKRLEGPLGPQNGFLKLSIAVKEGAPFSLRYYREKELETAVSCDQCTLNYTIYGVFAYCPDCGQHNSFGILNRNLDLIEKTLVVAEQQAEDVRDHLVGDALENTVSAFDAFGREAIRVSSQNRTNGTVVCSFQSLKTAQRILKNEFAFDLCSLIPPEDWAAVVTSFQKRHLLAHTMGVVDKAYIDATGDHSVPVGHKMKVSADEVRSLVRVLRALGAKLVSMLKVS